MKSSGNLTMESIAQELTTQNPSLASAQSSSTLDAKCSDSEYYRNPFNDFGCSDHQGGNCRDDWRWILDNDQVYELLESCPESCNVTCSV